MSFETILTLILIIAGTIAGDAGSPSPIDPATNIDLATPAIFVPLGAIGIFIVAACYVCIRKTLEDRKHFHRNAADKYKFMQEETGVTSIKTTTSVRKAQVPENGLSSTSYL